MSVHLSRINSLLFCNPDPEARQITAEGIQLDPVSPYASAGQGDDPPAGGSGGTRPMLVTLYGPQAGKHYDSPISERLQERIQFRVAHITHLLSGGGTYELPDEFDQGFELPIELQALHRIVASQWGNEDMTKAIGGHAWIIRLAALKAYVALHTTFVGISLDDQRTALGCLRKWFYQQEKSLAGAAEKAYEQLLAHVIEYNATNPQLVRDLLAKESKAIEASLIEHTDPSDGKERDQIALTFIGDIAKKV